MAANKPIALFSVWEKERAVEFARALSALGWRILSTGGTARVLREAGVETAEVSDLTGFPEILEGRVKTLHPKVFGGILAKSRPGHEQELARLGMERIRLVCVSLYPFEEVAEQALSDEERMEYVDVGGAALLRAAAKNYLEAIPVCDPADYTEVCEALQLGDPPPEMRRRLAGKAFYHLAYYDAVVAQTLLSGGADMPERMAIGLRKQADLRYGENPHQKAALYRRVGALAGIASAKQLHGKPLSFNNYLDLDAAWRTVGDFQRPTCAIIKHAQPCGIAEADSLPDAWKAAYECDPESAYGGIAGFNRPLDVETAAAMEGVFLEAVVAPDYAPEALAVLEKRKNLRILSAASVLLGAGGGPLEMRPVGGGLLVQSADQAIYDGEPRVATKRRPDPDEAVSLNFGFRAVKHVLSNAVALCSGTRTLAIAGGQTSRREAIRIAAQRMQRFHPVLPAGRAGRPIVLASDGFLPFADNVEEAARAGVTAIIQPGGSIRDKEVIAACDERGIAMLFAGRRHFRH